MHGLNGAFPRLGSQLEFIQEASENYLKDQTNSNAAMLQTLVSGFVNTIMVEVAGREIIGNGALVTAVCDSKKETSKTSSTRKRPPNDDIDPAPIKEKKKADARKKLSSADLPGFSPEFFTAQTFILKIIPETVRNPGTLKSLITLFTRSALSFHFVCSNKGLCSYENIWGPFLAALAAVEPYLVFSEIIEKTGFQVSFTDFNNWIQQIQTDFPKTMRRSEQEFIRVLAQEVMLESLPLPEHSERSSTSAASQVEAPEDTSGLTTEEVYLFQK